MDMTIIILSSVGVVLFIAGYFFSSPESFSEENIRSQQQSMQMDSDMARRNSIGGDHVGVAENGDWDNDANFTSPVRSGVSSVYDL